MRGFCVSPAHAPGALRRAHPCTHERRTPADLRGSCRRFARPAPQRFSSSGDLSGPIGPPRPSRTPPAPAADRLQHQPRDRADRGECWPVERRCRHRQPHRLRQRPELRHHGPRSWWGSRPIVVCPASTGVDDDSLASQRGGRRGSSTFQNSSTTAISSQACTFGHVRQSAHTFCGKISLDTVRKPSR